MGKKMVIYWDVKSTSSGYHIYDNVQDVEFSDDGRRMTVRFTNPMSRKVYVNLDKVSWIDIGKEEMK